MPEEPSSKLLNDLVAAAKKSGVEFNMGEAARWMVAMSGSERASPVGRDIESGVFGARIALLDFDPADLAYFRRLAEHVRAVRRPDVESAIAIAGSAAQGRVQVFPGDCDFFERLNIRASSAAEAQVILRDVMRATALRAFAEPDIVLVEVNLGVYPQAVVVNGAPHAQGESITWSPQDVVNGYISLTMPDGTTGTLDWDETSAGLGWTYLGWIVSDREAGRIALASNMLDVTWEAPDGAISSLDGSVDAFFQEIYLEGDALPIFTKLIREVHSDAQSRYVENMRREVFHYTHESPNYAKASKRLYNLFRVTDELETAAYMRELFDEPGARLYQVPGLLEAAEVALRDPSAEIDRATVLRQIDIVIDAVREATDGTAEAEIVGELEKLRAGVQKLQPGSSGDQDSWDDILNDVRKRCGEIVSEYFRVRLFGIKKIQDYIEQLSV